MESPKIIRITKDKKVEDKGRSKEQGQRMGNGNKCVGVHPVISLITLPVTLNVPDLAGSQISEAMQGQASEYLGGRAIITLNVSGPLVPSKRLSEWIKKQTVCCLQETHFKYKDTCRLKIRGWRTTCTLTLTLQKKPECSY